MFSNTHSINSKKAPMNMVVSAIAIIEQKNLTIHPSFSNPENKLKKMTPSSPKNSPNPIGKSP